MRTHPSPRGRLLVAACLAAAALAPATATAATTTEVAAAVDAGVQYMRAQQNASTGELSGFGGDYAASALSAARVHPADVVTGAGAPSLQDFLFGVYTAPAWTGPSDPATNATPGGVSGGALAGGMLWAYAAGLDPQRISEQQNLVAQLAGLAKRGDGLDGAFANAASNTQAWVLVGLARVGGLPVSLLTRAQAYLRAQQHTDGGWNFGRVTTQAQRDAAGGVDMTGLAIAALCDAGATANDPDVREGLAFLSARLNLDGSLTTPPNADSSGWAISGLNACDVDPQGAAWTSAAGETVVDGLLSLQVPPGAPGAGGFRSGAGANLYATQDAVRALAGESFSAEPPRRATTGAPRIRPVPVVAAGTVTPHALVVDDGRGDVRLCRVAAPAGAGLDVVLEAARTSAVPAGCVPSFAYAGGLLVEVDGKRTDVARGGWRLALDGRPEEPAGTQAVPFGDTVALRLEQPAGGSGTPPATGTPGQAPAAGGTGPAGSTGEPGATGERGATGEPGATGAAGPAGPAGVQGSTGAGRTVARRLCTVSGRTVRCAVQSTARARLTRLGKTYATGTTARMRTGRTVRPGRYTLRLTTRRGTTTLAVTVRRA